jgi:succinyl-diaminopimelate desuccinylase
MSKAMPEARPEALAVDRVSHILADLVRTESTNPGTPEVAMAQRVADWLRPTGAEVHFVETLPGRPSVAAVISGRRDGPTLVLNGHMDTVPVDDRERWSSDPFAAEQRDGYLYGRGACDMKAGLATQIAVAHALDPAQLAGRLVLQFAMGEECGEPGTLSLCKAGFVGDFGIVTEPTQLQVSVATRGLLAVRIGIRGRSAHASSAWAGHNPVADLPAVLAALDAYRTDIEARKHPLLGSGSCTPTVVNAGVKSNAIADSCELLVDRRLIPGESVEEELRAIEAALERARGAHPDLDCEVTVIPHPYEPGEVPVDSAFARRVCQIAAPTLGRTPDIVGTAYASDVRNLINDAGMEAITFGPGDIAECHCIDERVALEQLHQAAVVLADVALDVLQ